MPKEPEPPQLDAIGIESSYKVDGAGDSTDVAEVGLTGKEKSVSFQYGKNPFFQHTPFDHTLIAISGSPFASVNPGTFVDDVAEKSPIEEAPFAEPAAVEPQPEPAVDDADGRPALRNEQPVEESEMREFAPATQPEIEPLAVNPPKLAVQPVSVADAIQNILKDQDIHTSYLRQKKSKSKKKLHSRAYDKEMSKIEQIVSQNLRDQLENVGDPTLFFWRANPMN